MDIAKKKDFIINAAYIVVWVSVLYFVMRFAAVYLLPFLIGIIIAFYVQKPAYFLSKKFLIKKQFFAAILSVVIFLAIISILLFFCWILYFYIGRLLNYLLNLENDFQDIIKNIHTNFEIFIEKSNMKNLLQKITSETIVSFGTKITEYLSKSISTMIKNMPLFLLSSIVTVVSTCYIAKDYDKLIKFFEGFLKKDLYKKLVVFKDIINECVLKFLLGYFLIFIITFFELILGFALLGVNNFLSISFLVALLDALPIVGTGTFLLPWSIVSFLKNDFKFGIGLVVLYIFITIIKNFIEPKIIGKQIGLNPIFTLFFIFIGFRLYGIIGMLTLPLIITVLYTYFSREIVLNN